jgi:hypothetical protein
MKVKEFQPSELGDGVYGLHVGDVIPLGVLLKLADVELDSDLNYAGESSRYTGVAIQVDVSYENRHPFQWDFWVSSEIHYTYRVTALPIESYKATRTQVLENGDRVLQDLHGVFIYFSVQGDIAYFDFTQLQIVLTTLVSFVSVISLFMRCYAEYVWTHRESFRSSSYDKTVNLNVDDPICCLNMCEYRDSSDAFESYASNHEEFVKDFVSLDGEALRFAGSVLHHQHTHQFSDTDRMHISSSIKRQTSLDSSGFKGT